MEGAGEFLDVCLTVVSIFLHGVVGSLSDHKTVCRCKQSEPNVSGKLLKKIGKQSNGVPIPSPVPSPLLMAAPQPERLSMNRISYSDELVHFYTGLYFFKYFEVLYGFVEDCISELGLE